MITKDLGFIIKRWNFRETSLLATIYTKNYGKINGLFKGFYTFKKEFSSSLDIFTLNEFVFYPRDTEIWLVSYVDLIQEYSFLKDNLEKNMIASTFLHIINKSFPLQDKNRQVFFLLKDSLYNLMVGDEKKILYIFLIKFLTISGFKPEFNLCINCHNPYTEKVFFNTKEGGLICEKCKDLKTDSLQISLETSLTISYIQKNNFPHLMRINLTLKCEEEVVFILKKFLEHHLNFDLFSSLLYRYKLKSIEK